MTVGQLEGVVNSIGECQAVRCTVGKSTTPPMYDWDGHLKDCLNLFDGISAGHQFVFRQAEPGVVEWREHVDGPSTKTNLLKRGSGAKLAQKGLPKTISAAGLSVQRQWQLYNSVRDAIYEPADKDAMCPKPSFQPAGKFATFYRVLHAKELCLMTSAPRFSGHHMTECAAAECSTRGPLALQCTFCECSYHTLCCPKDSSQPSKQPWACCRCLDRVVTMVRPVIPVRGRGKSKTVRSGQLKRKPGCAPVRIATLASGGRVYYKRNDVLQFWGGCAAGGSCLAPGQATKFSCDQCGFCWHAKCVQEDGSSSLNVRPWLCSWCVEYIRATQPGLQKTGAGAT